MQECLIKAEEALKAANLCYDHGLHDSCASRCYYAMFWAAIAALEWAGSPSQKWNHSGLSSVFGKELVKKRRLLSPTLAGRLGDGYDLRRLADYERRPVGKKRTKRVLDGARKFVACVKEVVTK
ncbi:MAG TPA: HEPN domain-containing protein [Anaerolineae bacterium]|nr:HEPN domain-containing protein [Anaerolineae bacterium]